MCDINQLKNLGTPMTFSQVPQSIFKALNEKYQNNCIGFDTAIYCAAGDVDRFEPILACLNREANALYKKNYFQLLHKKTPKNVTIMHLAAKFGYANMMKELVYIHPTLRDKTAKGVTPLEVAVEQKQQEVAQVLSQSLLDEELLTRQIGKLQLK